MIISDEQHRANVVARWHELEAGKLARVISIVNERALPIKRRHHERINAVLNNDRMSVHAKIEALWEAVDELGVIAAHAACHKGCSHCCHVAVLIPTQEAALIGKRIGVKPKPVHGITRREDVRAGYDNPCPFLKDGACSIYASRPLACRQQYNMDSDPLLCELVGDEGTKVPYLNLMDYNTALVYMTTEHRQHIARDKRTGLPVPVEDVMLTDVGDIREFFPNGKK